MAYPRPPPGGPVASNPGSERSRTSWESGHHMYQQSMERIPQTSMISRIASTDLMDPESSDGDVSVTGGGNHYSKSPPSLPASLPLPPPQHGSESSDSVQDRLHELSRVEDHNIRKHESLLAKRRRKDDKVFQRRDLQDRKIRAIMDARARRDTRVMDRRKREDAAFKRFDEQLEEEEMNLHRRLKRLKRGLPIEESPQISTRSIQSTSMSPPGPTYSTIPPPAKRHQSGPPGPSGPSDSFTNGPLPPPPQQQHHYYPPVLPPPQYQHHTPPITSQNAPPTSQTSFYQSNVQSHNVPYHPPPPLAPPSRQFGPQSTSSPSAPSNIRSSDVSSNDRLISNINGQPTSPMLKTSQPPASNHSLTPSNPNTRQPSSTYDTRPPPATTSSGFASINTPQNPGFAPINSKTISPTPGSIKSSSSDTTRILPNGSAIDYPMNSRMYGYGASPNSTPNSISSAGKRTPSTTHPYQMSEAFANRHHHCERVDGLSRGIWTSYGPGGSQDAPTGPPTEMYLRCNHDDCRRIDWKTVHGLQCHIVKNHEQPKGTIGSLEKALDRYGVPVKEVEEHEREHGEGSGGTMADPKNLKIKNKTREAAAGRGNWRRSSPGPHGVDPMAKPAGYKPDSSAGQNIPDTPNTANRSPTTKVYTGGRSYIPSPAGGYIQTDISTSDRDETYRKGPNPSDTNLRDNVETGLGTSKKFKALISTKSNAGITSGEEGPKIGPIQSEYLQTVRDNSNAQGSDNLEPVNNDKEWSQSTDGKPQMVSTTPPIGQIPHRDGDRESVKPGIDEERRSILGVENSKVGDNLTSAVTIADTNQDQEPDKKPVVEPKTEHFNDSLVNGDSTQKGESVNPVEEDKNPDEEGEGSTIVPIPPPPTTRSRRSTLQSPILTTKAPPTSTNPKIGSRRSSEARNASIDGMDGIIVPSKGAEKENESKIEDKTVNDDNSTAVKSNFTSHDPSNLEQLKDMEKDLEPTTSVRLTAAGGKTSPRRIQNARSLRKGRV